MCGNSWFCIPWDKEFVDQHKPSINYLELYAVTTGILHWLHLFRNKRIIIFCDNMSVVHMVNSNVSCSKQCRVLLRILVLHSMICNTRVFARHIPTRLNVLSDSLSRLQFCRFAEEAQWRGKNPSTVSLPPAELIWPLSKVFSTRKLV